jgi:hypothetical protein
MVKAIALAMALAVPCWADDASTEHQRSTDDAPAELCLKPADRIALAQALTAKDAEIASLQSSVRAAPSPALVVVLVVAGVLVGGAAGAGIVAAAKK